MEKLYIMLTYDIHPIGGTQMYCAVKAEWLEKQGYRVVILFSGSNIQDCTLTTLNQYVDGGNILFAANPAFLADMARFDVLLQINSIIGHTASYEHIYIESQYDIAALWGEYLAEQFRSKHIFFALNERFRGINKWYENYMDFFKFKYYRDELYGGVKSLKNLFDGFLEIKDIYDHAIKITEGKPIQDVSYDNVNQVEKLDYNITHIGKFNKHYVHNVIKGVGKFCENHGTEQVQFICVGNENSSHENRDYLLELEHELKNLKVVFLGDLVPIPRSIYSKSDCIIACGGCAAISAKLAPTIVADNIRLTAAGVLGYTCFSESYALDDLNEMDFCTALENTLVDKSYKDNEFTDSIDDFAVSDADINKCQEESLHLFEIEKKQEYYDVLSAGDYIIQRERRLYMYNDIYRYWFENELAGKKIDEYLQRKEFFKIAIYGAGTIGKILFKRLKDTAINIICMIDSNIQLDKKEYFGLTKVLSFSETTGFYEADAIIVTPVYAFHSIRRSLSAVGMDEKAVSFADIVYEMNKQ